MSILSGVDEVLVWPEVHGTDAVGNPVRVPAAAAVTVLGRVEPVSSAESSAGGQQVVTRARFVGREWPAGAASVVSWGGRSWDVDGEPQRHAGSPATAHVVVQLVARGPEPLS